MVQPRKSYEFEDLLQSSTENSRVDWYAQTKLGLTRTLSEENVYEDILGKRQDVLGCRSACEKGEGGPGLTDSPPYPPTHKHLKTYMHSSE